MRFPATPGWVSLAVVVGAPRHSWLRAPGAVPRDSWVGFAGGGGVWSLATAGCVSWLRFPATPGWGVRWWRWWVGPCHSWLRVQGAVPRHSWLGSAGRVGGCFRVWGFPVLCVLVARCVRMVSVLMCLVCVRGVCVGGGASVGVPSACVCVCVCVCVVCCWGVVAGPCFLWLLSVLVGVWLVCAVVGPSPLLAEVPVCDSPPLLAGFRCRWWWVFLATPGSGPRVRFPATPGWGPLAVVVCGSPPLLAGSCQLRWGVSRVGVSLVLCVCGVCGCAPWPCCVVCCVFVVSALLGVWCAGAAWVCLALALVCVVASVWCAGGPWFVVPTSFGLGLQLVFVWVWLVCGAGLPPLLAERPRCCAPPLLAGVRRCVVAVGPLPLLADGFGCGAPPVLAGFRRRVWWLVPRDSWPRAVGVVPRHSWLGSAGCGGGGPLAIPGCGPRGALLFGPGVCVCAAWRFVLVWVACGGPARCGCRVCACVCVHCVVCGVCHTLVGSRRWSAWSWPKSRRKAKEQVL